MITELMEIAKLLGAVGQVTFSGRIVKIADEVRGLQTELADTKQKLAEANVATSEASERLDPGLKERVSAAYGK